MSSTAFLSMWLSNTSTAAMVMPIVEAVAQQVISAEAEVEATQMTYFSGSTNQALEIDGITFALATVGSSYLGNGINSRIIFWINYPQAWYEFILTLPLFPSIYTRKLYYPNILPSINGWIYILWQKGKKKNAFSMLQPVW